MISSIEITRFRGIREGKLEDLTPLVVLVGPNGCGKSSVLDALLISANPAPEAAVARTVERHAGVEEGWRWLYWRGETEKPPMILARNGEGFRRECRLDWQRISPMRGIDREVRCNVELNAPETEEGDESDAAFSYRDAMAHDRCPPLADVPHISLLDTRAERAQTKLHELYSASVRRGRREQVKSVAAQVVPGLVDFEILTEGNTPILYLIYEDRAIPAALAGDGIHALVRAALELASLPEGIVLFEEPEVHQHPGAIRQTMRAVLAAVRRDIQVILTTHSLELIDALLAESSDEDLDRLSLYRMQLENGALQSHRMSGPEVAFSRQQIEDDLR